MKLEKKKDIIRNALWVLLLCAAFLLQTTYGFMPHIGAAKLLPLLPMLSCVCMFEKQKAACWYGLGAGLLMDVVSPSMVGYNALIMMLLCALIGWLSTNYLRNTLLTNLLTGSVFIFLNESLYWLFFVDFKQTAGAGGMYFSKVLPTVIVTSLLIIPFFFLALAIYKKYRVEEII